MFSLAGAPLVIAQRKVINVRMAGQGVGQRESLSVDISKQGTSDLRYLIRQITRDEVREQIKLDNLPTRLTVDNNEQKPLELVERRTQVQFGNTLDMLLIRAIERSLMSSIRTNAVNAADAALGTMAQWEWAYAPKAGQRAEIVKVDTLPGMAAGSYLILRPKTNRAGLANMYAARKDAGKPLNSIGRSGGRGFMSKGISALKRSNLAKNYILHIVFTMRYRLQSPAELYFHGTPVVVLRAKRNRGYRGVRI